MSAEEKNDSSTGALSGSDRVDDVAEVLGGEEVWQTVEEGGKRTI
jgi:hypothetical protein